MKSTIRHRSSRYYRPVVTLLLASTAFLAWPFACKSPPPAPGVASTPAATAPGALERPSGALSLLPHPAFAFADTGAARVSIADIAERVTPSVVSVSSQREVDVAPPMGFPFFFRQGPTEKRRQSGLGSGVIVSETGIVLTNNHVIEGADEIRVTAADGREYQAELKGADEQSDLAVLQLKGNVEGLTALSFGDSARLRLGDVVLAIGNPFGVGQTVTMGIVSAKGRANVGIVDYEDFIQTDAAINPGNSGGALVDMEGNLIGVNTAILSRSGGYQGIGFAIPTNMVRPIMDSLLKHGKVVRGYLGVGIQELTQTLRQAMKLGRVDGVLISSVEPNSAADKGGVQRGDIVTAVDGVTVDSTGRLRNVIASKGANAEVRLELLRNGKKTQAKVKLGEVPTETAVAKDAPETDKGSLGLQLVPLTPELAQRFSIDRKSGVLIAQVAPGSPAAEAGLRPGDVVIEVNQQPVAKPGDVVRLAKEDGPVLFVVERQGRSLFIAVER